MRPNVPFADGTRNCADTADRFRIGFRIGFQVQYYGVHYYGVHHYGVHYYELYAKDFVH